MIVLIGSEKGGTGKTTIATSLAVMRASAGRDVLLLDTDPQATASYWSRLRAKTQPASAKITCVQAFKDVREPVRKLAEKYDDVVIDTGGRDSPELRSAMFCTQRLYIPLQPSQFDLWTIKKMEALVDEVSLSVDEGLKAFIVLNLAPTNPFVKDAEEAKELIVSANLERLRLSDAIIKKRSGFQKAVREGLCVTEIGGEKNAVDEIFRLYTEIYGDDREDSL